VGAASNALGTVTDLKPIVRAAHEAGALVYIDAVQSVPHLPTDVSDLDCDFLACSSYKFFGPHAGILYGKREHLERLTPHKVRPAKDTIPHCWEQGTLNHEGLAGITAAVEYLSGLKGMEGTLRERLCASMTAIRDCEQGLSAALLNGLARVSGVRVLGLTDTGRVDERVPTVAFTKDGETPRQVCERLGAAGICSWNGNYYALSVMERYGLEATGGAVRVGLAHYNTREEIDRFLNVLG
jgi:selenocysteine lyase/cysteine desulfurase